MASQHEYEAHALVRELTVALGCEKGEVGPEKYTEALMKNRGPYNPTEVISHHSKRTIAETSQKPNEFLDKHEELKMKNIRDVESVTFIAAELAKDSKTAAYLKSHAAKKAEQAGKKLEPHDSLKMKSGKRDMTPAKLAELKKNLMDQTHKTASLIPSNILQELQGGPRREANITIPTQPAWLEDRPQLSQCFVKDSSYSKRVLPIGTLPEILQEHAVCEDLLAALQGFDTDLIKPSMETGVLTFTLEPSLPQSLKDHVNKILPIAQAYQVVHRFVQEKSRFEQGLVNQALSAGLDRVLEQWSVFICQLYTKLNEGRLTLQQLFFYLQHSKSQFSLLESICNYVNKGHCFGAGTLSLIHNRLKMLTGDAQCRKQCLDLCERSAAPYLRMLQLWLYKGQVVDPYKEFMVSEDTTVNKERLIEEYNDAYWDKRYTLCRNRIPIFLEVYADKILNTGKYLNVVRICGESIVLPDSKDILYSALELDYRAYIETAYSFASKLLLDLLINKHDLFPRLRSMKRFFLLDQGDFVVQFMDMTDAELKKPASRISEERLEHLLELTIRDSTANIDPNKDSFRVVLLDHDLITQLLTILSLESTYEQDVRQINPTELNLTGLEAFSFDCMVQWPLSLVFNRKMIFRYQMLLRNLFYMKHVERQLIAVWECNSGAKAFTQLSQFSQSFHVRNKMLNFMQHLQYYLQIEVIATYWAEFEEDMSKVSNIDEVLSLHQAMLHNCLRDCMLTNPELLKILSKLQSVCVLFCNFMQRTYHSIDVDHELSPLNSTSSLQGAPVDAVAKKRQTQKLVVEHVEDFVKDGSFEKTVDKFDRNFTETLVQLLTAISSQKTDSRLLNLLYRVNFNGYYSAVLEQSLDQSR